MYQKAQKIVQTYFEFEDEEADAGVDQQMGSTYGFGTGGNMPSNFSFR